MRIVSVANQKGGVGKTTTAINLGAIFAEMGLRTLIVDVDPQGNASTGLGVSRETRRGSVFDVLVGELSLTEISQATGIDRLSVVPGSNDLTSLDIELTGVARRASLLRNAFRAEGRVCDIVLIDCPPAMNLLTINALVASDGVLVPLQTEFFALEGLSQLMLTIREIRGSANPTLRIDGIALTMYDRRNNLSRQVDSDVRATLGDLVYETRIPRNVRLSEAPSHAQPITSYDPTSRGSIAYRALAREYLDRVGRMESKVRAHVEHS